MSHFINIYINIIFISIKNPENYNTGRACAFIALLLHQQSSSLSGFEAFQTEPNVNSLGGTPAEFIRLYLAAAGFQGCTVE